MVLLLRELIENKPHQSVVFRPMLLVYTICTVMSGSAVRTTGIVTMKKPRRMAVLGSQVIKMLEKYYAVVLGTSILLTAVLRFAPTTSPFMGAATSGCVLYMLPPGLHSLCSLCLLAPCLFSAEGGSILKSRTSVSSTSLW